MFGSVESYVFAGNARLKCFPTARSYFDSQTLAAVGRRGKSFSGCRCAVVCIGLSDLYNVWAKLMVKHNCLVRWCKEQPIFFRCSSSYKFLRVIFYFFRPLPRVMSKQPERSREFSNKISKPERWSLHPATSLHFWRHFTTEIFRRGLLLHSL